MWHGSEQLPWKVSTNISRHANYALTWQEKPTAQGFCSIYWGPYSLAPGRCGSNFDEVNPVYPYRLQPLWFDGNIEIDGLVQERCYSSALALELRLSCTNPSRYNFQTGECHRTSLMRSQHWFSWWLGAVRQQVIIWTRGVTIHLVMIRFVLRYTACNILSDTIFAIHISDILFILELSIGEDLGDRIYG